MLALAPSLPSFENGDARDVEVEEYRGDSQYGHRSL